MSPNSNTRISRKDFLKLLGLTGAVAVGGSLADTYAPWLDYQEQINQTTRPFETQLAGKEKALELVRYATLAANGHNTQPWKFKVREDSIEIHPDYSRRVPVVDPQDRELWISLGCALENLTLAAQANGYFPDVTYPDDSDHILVKLEADIPQNSPLFDAIPQRQNTRSEYDGQSLQADQLDQLHNLDLEPGISIHIHTQSSEIETVLAYVNEGNLNQYADQNFVDELIEWLRFNKKEAMNSLDGLYSICTGNPNVPGWLGRMFVASTKPEQMADTDAKNLRSSAGALIITSAIEDKTAWVKTGQVYERLALKMTALNIKSALLNQPIEVANIRNQFQSAMDLGNFQPQLLLRFGYADWMPRSLRRPIEEVIF